jgi:hypothetical protein
MSYELSLESAMPKLLLRGLAIFGYEGYAKRNFCFASNTPLST